LNVDNEDDEDDDEDYDPEEDDGTMQIPPSVYRRILALKELQDAREVVQERYRRERAELEAKFRQEYEPLFIKRADIVAGRLDVQKPEPAPESEGADAEEEGDDVMGIPQFWLMVLLHNESVVDLITQDDVPALEYLVDITCEDKVDLTGFRLDFHFAPNPFFKNEVLSKAYDMASIVDHAEPVLEKVTGTSIDWKPEHCLTMREVKRGGKVRVVKRPSFFNFFDTPIMMTPEEQAQNQELLKMHLTYETDYEYALIFRNHLVPEAVLWFTGEAQQDEDDEEYYEEEEEEEEDLEDDEDEDAEMGPPGQSGDQAA